MSRFFAFVLPCFLFLLCLRPRQIRKHNNVQTCIVYGLSVTGGRFVQSDPQRSLERLPGPLFFRRKRAFFLHYVAFETPRSTTCLEGLAPISPPCLVVIVPPVPWSTHSGPTGNPWHDRRRLWMLGKGGAGRAPMLARRCVLQMNEKQTR